MTDVPATTLRRSRVSRQLTEDLLSAVSADRLSVEANCAPRRPSKKFQQAAGRLLAIAQSEERRAQRVRAVRDEPALLRKAQRALKRQLSGDRDAHVGLGRHYRGGLAQDEFGLVVHVHAKREVSPEHAIRPLAVRYRGG
jgi:hypothetical protein